MSPTEGPLLIAHRAGNELRSLAPAAAAGAHLIELDVWLHRGRLEVGHNKTLGWLPLLWDRWELSLDWRRELLVSDVLRHLPAGSEPMFDLKGESPGLPAALRELIDEHLPNRSYSVSSQNWQYLEHFLEVERARVVRSIGSDAALERMRDELDTWAGAGIGLDSELLTPPVVAELRERTPLILTWTVNELERATELVRAGVGGIISDNLELIRAMRAEHPR